MMQLCEPSKCSGCCACMNICPTSAIEMQENTDRSMIPVIKDSLCIQCGACQKCCPVISKVETYPVMKTYAAWSNNKSIVDSSASAGIVTSLSLHTIKQGGIVFGTRYENRKLIFDYSDNAEKLKLFQGSKYVYADVGHCYQETKKILCQGKPVLFVATPCQIAGLRAYLGKDYAHLVTVDLICHGVAPSAFLDEYLNKVPFDNVLFRGPEGLRTAAYCNGKLIYSKVKPADLFYTAYVKGLIHRENCYSCPYASSRRTGDITAGDFWGLNRETLRTDSQNVPYISLVFTNTPKGETALKEIDSSIIWEERSLEEAMDKNAQLKAPCIPHKDRSAFLQYYQENSFTDSVKKTDIYREIKRHRGYYFAIDILRTLKRKIKR